MHVLTLLSGGIDSSTLVHYYLDKGFEVSALFVDYGQPDNGQEHAAAASIGKHYGIHVESLDIKAGRQFCPGYIRGRNGMLLMLGLFQFRHETGLISLGIHSGTNYSDCRTDFVDKMQKVFDIYEEGKVQIDAPFLAWNKTDIYNYAVLSGVPLTLAFSSNSKDLPPEICPTGR